MQHTKEQHSFCDHSLEPEKKVYGRQISEYMYNRIETNPAKDHYLGPMATGHWYDQYKWYWARATGQLI